jgi:uncharacterized protein YdeI (YjbR/CyaY-like superfamily)
MARQIASPKPPLSDLPTHTFSCAEDFESFLEREHAAAPGFYLKVAKKSSGIATVSTSDAIETALCYGWIDGRVNSIDDCYFTVRYTPRRPKSIWSQKNVQTIARLIEQGRMRPPGLEAVNAAKADGRWERAYAGPATMEVPEDFKTALASAPAAKAFFENLNRSDRYAVLWRIETASPTSRAGRINALLEMLAVGTVPGVKPKVVGKAKSSGQVKDKVKKSSSSTTRPRKKTDAQDVDPQRREGLRRRK